MTRLLSTMKTDISVQIRNQLYTIAIGIAIIFAIIFSQLIKPEQIVTIIPAMMLLIVGGTTLLSVGGMIIAEKDEGTLSAVIVSPLRTSEYLWSKIITLTILATLEVVVLIGGALFIMGFSKELVWPNIPILLIGIIAINVSYTILGIALSVRYNKITDYIVPVLFIVIILQLPILHFWGIFEHSAFFFIPSSAPIQFIQGAFLKLDAWKWFYAVGYVVAQIIGLTIWAYKAFDAHIIRKVG